MPTELGNLLIRVTSVGFDEVLRNLGELESALGRVGANSSLGRISQQLDQMSRYMRDMHGDLGRLTILQEQNASQMSKQGKQAQEASDQLSKFDKTLQGIAKTYTLVMTAVAVGRKFKNSIEQIASFNLAVSNMAMNANMARGSLMELGAIAQGLGGSRQGVAALGSRFQTDMMNLRMGRGGGATLDVATTYGLSLRGSGHGGLATSEEMMRNVAELFERMGNSELAKLQKLDIKRMLGIDDGTFKMLDKGVKEYDESIKRAAIRTKEMADATSYSEKVSAELAQIEQEWNDAKLKMLYAMKPLVDPLLKSFKEVAEWVKKNPGLAGSIATIVGSLGALSAAIVLIKKVFGGGGNKKLVQAITEALSQNAGGAGGSSASAAGGAVGGVGRAFAGAAKLAAGAGVVDAVAGGFQRQIQIHSLSKLELIVEAWHGEWRAFTLLSNLGKNRDLFSNDSYKKMLAENGVYDDKLQNLWLVAADSASRMNAYSSEVARDEYNRRAKEYEAARKTGGSSVTISEIRIEVNSNAANADEVAQAVREELFKQINASIDDAIIKGRVL